ncbi:MAG: replication initiator protein [Microviridae sp.]|nr:MAG: replication initiator protein [Microviridae sp.]
MPCFKPISIPKRGYVDLRVTVACGQCIGCRVDRTEDWTTRIMHEVTLHDLCQFVTLTYSDEQLPANGSLVKKDYQDFMKRLRKRHGARIRYFAVGEYGDTFERPHYHAILFGIDFADKRPHSKNEHGDQLFTSDLLDSIWGKGHAFFGKVTVQSARYVAKYCIKKVNGPMAVEHYGAKSPEFAVMSLKPGIGSGWFEKFQADVYPSDFVVLQGKKRSPPRFYDERLSAQDEAALEAIKSRRLKKALEHRADQTPSRLKARQECLKARINLRKGKL